MKVRKHLEIYQSRKRGLYGDYRKMGAWAVFSYVDENGDEFRKAFWAKAGTTEEEFWKSAPEEIQ